MREPLIVSFSRFRVAWAEFWLEVVAEISRWGQRNREEAQFIIDAWEGEWPDEG